MHKSKGCGAVRVKRLKKVRINCRDFSIEWSKKTSGGSFNFTDRVITIGLKHNIETEIFEVLCHELMEIVMCEMYVRLSRPDCDTDYIFVLDHRQFSSAVNMFSGLINQFIGGPE